MKNEVAAKKNTLNDVKKIERQSSKKIKKGLEKTRASTGKPINELKGGAKFMAQLSNIGGGSKATGGKGISDGFNTIIQNQSAKAVLKTASKMGQNKERKKLSTNKTK